MVVVVVVVVGVESKACCTRKRKKTIWIGAWKGFENIVFEIILYFLMHTSVFIVWLVIETDNKYETAQHMR